MVNPRAVAAGTTAILRRLAAERPLVVAIDDAQWLDSTSADALMFAARRLGDASVGFLATVRTPVKAPAALLGLGEALPERPDPSDRARPADRRQPLPPVRCPAQP